MTNLKLLVFTGILAIALSALCSVPGFGDGTCIKTSKCSRAGGKSHKGYCSGKSSIQCCTSVKCGNDGICKKKGTSNGSMVSGLCPGDASFVCYKKRGSKIASAAKSQVGKWPYSWGGGNNNGATVGIKQGISPYCDDRHVKGFDCSGLAKYSVYQGTGVSLPHNAQQQYNQAKSSRKIGINQ